MTVSSILGRSRQLRRALPLVLLAAVLAPATVRSQVCPPQLTMGSAVSPTRASIAACGGNPGMVASWMTSLRACVAQSASNVMTCAVLMATPSMSTPYAVHCSSSAAAPVFCNFVCNCSPNPMWTPANSSLPVELMKFEVDEGGESANEQPGKD